MGKLSALKQTVDNALDMSHAARMQRARDMDVGEEVLYHGTAGDINEFSPDGSVTKARSAKAATWLTDDPDVAAGYARMAAEDKPVQDLIDASQAAERRGDWDAAEGLIGQAENLEQGGSLVGGGGQSVMPLRARTSNLMEIDADGATMSDLDDSQLFRWTEEAKAGGYDGLKIKNFSDNADWGVYRPATHYAIFDPSNIRSVNAAFDPAKKDSANLLAGGAAAAVGLGALQSEDADASMPDPAKSVAAMASAGEFTRRRAEKQGYWQQRRQELMQTISNTAETGFNALDMPWRGLLGASRVAGGLVAGEGFDRALDAGVQQIRQPLEDTAYDVGAAAADATGSPAVGAAVNAGVQFGGPI